MNALLRRLSVLGLFGALALTSSAGLTGCAVDSSGALTEEDDASDGEDGSAFDLPIRGDKLRRGPFDLPGRIPTPGSVTVEDPPCEGGCWPTRPQDPGAEDPGCNEEPGSNEEPSCPSHEGHSGCGGHGHEHEHGKGQGHTEHGQGHGYGHGEEGEGSSCGGGSGDDD